MRLLIGLMIGAAAATAAIPEEAAAQGKGQEKRSRVERHDEDGRERRGENDEWYQRGDRDDDRDRRYDDRDRRYDRNERDRRWDRDTDRGGKGPKFCRNGQGHPVHGREWCRQKGFGTDARWERARWEDVIFGRPSRRDSRGDLDRGTLGGILGDIVFGRLDSRRQQLGVRDPLRGRWSYVDGGRILEVAAGGLPIAQLHDRNGDGRVDLVLLNRLR